MKEPFEFKVSNKVYKVYSVQRLISLCKHYTNRASTYLREGDIEEWLDYIGEYEAAEIAIKHLDTDNIYKFCDEVEDFLKSRTILNELEKAIEIFLKEYDVLREEIMQHFQARTQIILLGLAAIFTIAGLALAPLTGLLTVEEITIKDVNIPLVILNEKYQGIDKSQFEKETNINSLQIKKTSADALKIERTTQGQTVLRAIIPSIVIFCWIIPLGSIYIILRNIRISKKIIEIGEYIANVIEYRQYQYFSEKINIVSNSNQSQRLSQYFYPLSWETYTSDNYKAVIDFEGSGIVYFIFSIIVLLSLTSGFILLNMDYADNNLINEKVIKNCLRKFILLIPCILIILLRLLNLLVKKKNVKRNKYNSLLFGLSYCSAIIAPIYFIFFHTFKLASLSEEQFLLSTILQISFEILPISYFTSVLAYLFFEELLPLNNLRKRIARDDIPERVKQSFISRKI